MDILLISRCPPYPLHLGDRLIPYHLAQQLSARHNIELLAFYDQPDDPANVPHYQQFFRSVELIPEPRRSTLQMITRLGHMFPRTAAEAWSPEMWRAIESRLATKPYDIVQLFGGVQVYEYRNLVSARPNLIVPYESYSLYLSRMFTSPPTPLYSVARSGKLSTGSPSPFAERGSEGEVQKLSTWLQLQAARRYERAMFSGYDGVVVLTDIDAKALPSTLPLHVIPNGIDLDYFTPAEADASEPILLFVGNFDYAPNLDAALFLAREIFPLVKRDVPAARLQLVGNNPPEALRNLASADIAVTGRVPDVRPYLQQAAVFISPLRFGAGIKNKVLEAMAMGKALVATPLSGEGIGLVHGTHTLFGSASGELATAAVRLLRDPTLRREMGAANRRVIKMTFTWERVAEQYEALYMQIRRDR